MYKFGHLDRDMELPDFIDAINQELRAMEFAMREIELSALYFDVLTAAPAKTQVGMVVYANGANWNPGAGEGLYVLKSTGWVAL